MGVAKRRRNKPTAGRKRDKRAGRSHTLARAIRHSSRRDVPVADEDATLNRQFATAGLAVDANASMRKRKAEPDAAVAEAVVKAKRDASAPSVPAVVAGTSLREPPKAAPQVLFMSAAQARYLNDLRQKHGQDLQAMRRDIKLNYDQLTEGQLRKLFLKFDKVWPAHRPVPEFSTQTNTDRMLDLLADEIVQEHKRRKSSKPAASSVPAAIAAAAAAAPVTHKDDDDDADDNGDGKKPAVAAKPAAKPKAGKRAAAQVEFGARSARK